MKYLLCITILMLLISSCKQRGAEKIEGEVSILEAPEEKIEEHVWEVDFSEHLDNRKDIFLSDIARSVSYIPMETTNEYLIGEKGLSVKPCGDYIFVGQHNSPLGVFDREGRFLRTIGKIGKGPEEFNNDYYFYPEEKGQKVIFINAFRSTLMEYSWDGNFIREIKPELKPFHFAPVDASTNLIWTGFQIEDDIGFFRLAFVDDEGLILKKIYEDKREMGARMSFLSPLITPSLTGLLYNSWEEEGVFRVLPDTTMNYVLKWKLGSYEMPFKPMDDYNRFDREKHKYVYDINAVEGPENWYFKYTYSSKLQMGIYSKKTGELLSANNPDTEQNGVFNDIDGGPSFWPFWDAEKGGIYYKMIPAIELLGFEQQEIKYNKQAKDPNAADQYASIVSKLNEASNPVLMVVELK